MKNFFKENYALVAGIALPLALIAAFFLAGKVGVSTVPDPRYDAVFAANYSRHASSNRYKVGVDDGKLIIRVRPRKDANGRVNYRVPDIYVFDHKTLYARKIDIDFDNVVDGKISDPELDALNRNRINPDPISPDGYKFEYRGRGSGGLFAEVFGWRRRGRSVYVLRNGPRAVPVVGSESIKPGHFIGWVEK